MNKSVLTKKCLLVTGAEGRIGRLLQATWAGRGVVWSGRRSGLAWEMEGPAPVLPEGAVVLHLAGATAGEMGRNQAAARTLSAALRPGQRVVLVSSIAVYGTGPGPFRESDPLAPQGAYASAKAEVETILAPHAPLILRLGNLFGADALTRAVAAGPVVLDRAGDLGPLRSWIGPLTFARVLWSLLEAPPGILNLAQPPALPMGALLTALGARWSLGPRDAPVPIAEMDLTRLSALTDLPPATPEGLVAELSALKGSWP